MNSTDITKIVDSNISDIIRKIKYNREQIELDGFNSPPSSDVSIVTDPSRIYQYIATRALTTSYAYINNEYIIYSGQSFDMKQYGELDIEELIFSLTLKLSTYFEVDLMSIGILIVLKSKLSSLYDESTEMIRIRNDYLHFNMIGI